MLVMRRSASGAKEEQVVTALSVRFARALSQGRKIKQAPQTRPQLLATLLRKRAAAHAAGAGELEALLRDQIRWALPVDRSPGERPG
jgi:hypothetical protein